jgi:hypothetical protein
VEGWSHDSSVEHLLASTGPEFKPVQQEKRKKTIG